MAKAFYPLAAALMLAGCAPTPPQPKPQTTCTANQLQSLVGQSAKVLQTMRFGSEMRITRPGTAITQDFRATRLNISIDANEKISRVFCG